MKGLLQAAPHYKLIGADGSPYSCKMRAIFRFRRLPFRWVPAFQVGLHDGSMWEALKPQVKVPVIPVLVDLEGIPKNDSTPLVQMLERKHPERSVNPSHKGDRFLSLLLEDFGDEWMTKVMFESRFHTEKDAVFGAEWQFFQNPAFASTGTEPSFFGIRQRKRRNLVGCDDWATMEKSLEEVCEALTGMVKSGSPFLFGEHPSVADFALYGQLRQCACDPLPSRIMYEYPAAWAWVWRVEDLSGFEPGEDPFKRTEFSKPTPTVQRLLNFTAKTYLPFLVANDAAIKTGAKEVSVEILDGVATHKQPPFKYQASCLRELRREYSSLSGSELQYVDRSLEEAGCLSVFKTVSKI